MVEPTLNRVRLVLLGCAIALSGCFPSLEDEPWHIRETRILAVRGTPAEAGPNERVKLEALVASPLGLGDGEVTWSFCLAPRTSAERTGVTQSCLRGEDLEPTKSRATIPMDACARFGPNPPPTEGDEPQARPADPDASGGYFLPIQAATVDETTGGDVTAFGFQRIRCDLPAVTRATFDAYQELYTLNQNPELASLEVMREGNSEDPTLGVSVRAGEQVKLRLTATEASSEPYVVYDTQTSTLRARGEALSVSWFVTGGTLELGSQTLSAQQLQDTAFENAWVAPSQSGRVFGWAVLRDDRSGASWATLSFDVQ